MNLGAIIDVAIGLIFVWIVISLATIQIQEWISTMLDKRARDLEAAIHEILANPNLTAQFYDHPVIRGLTSKKRRKPSSVPTWFYRYPIVRGFTKEKRKLPSYIPAQQFALALFDIALTAGTESSIIQQALYRIRDDLQQRPTITKQSAVIEELNLLADLARSAAATEAGTYITNKSLVLLKDRVAEFSEKYSKQYPELQPVIKTAFEEADQHKDEIARLLKNYKAGRNADPAMTKLRRGIVALGVISPELNQTLNALLLNIEQYVSQGETNFAQARKNVETWFNDSMDRVSGVFKRYSQVMALIIGFFIALFLNVDSINLTSYLWREPSVRQVLAERATAASDSGGIVLSNEFQTDPYKAMQDFRQQFIGLGLPVGWTIRAKSDPLFEGAECTLVPQGNQFFGISMSGRCISSSPPDHSANWVTKLIGIILTAVAAAQGAPFWFDILKKVVNLRGTGANPAEKESK
ncbi:MAG TPA: hypothetical protein VK206_04585 [Anaerolineales bacterium]|nr:hypothetical protein [Anaerolineales bacterium]